MKLPPKSRSKLGLLKRNVEMLGCRYEVPAADDPDNVIVAVYLREKKSSLTYSPSNLFGQPLLLGIPRYNMSSFIYVRLFLNTTFGQVTSMVPVP